MTSKIVCHAVESSGPGAQNQPMPRKARATPPLQRKRTLIKEWRKHRAGMTLAGLSERLEVEEGYTVSEGQLSRVERAEQPYTQDLLEAIARVLRCEPQDLLSRDPNAKKSPLSVLEEIQPTPQEQRQAAAIIQTLRATGTDN